ncbi:hypothetical protein ACHAWC_010224 [Mediolabrus comicus]
MMEEDSQTSRNNNAADIDEHSMATDDFEALLSVPVEVIFREIMQTQTTAGKRTNQRTFLFSKSEVATLLRVTMLASELTTTIVMVYDALDRTRKGKIYRSAIEAATLSSTHNTSSNVYLRALLPIIDIHSETSQIALNNITCETLGIHRIIQELDDCANELSKFSETNFNMADQLDWTMTGQSSILSKEKRAIAEIEDAVVSRIAHLKEMAIGGENGAVDDKTNNDDMTDDATKSSSANHHDLFIPMKDLCQRIFKQKEKSEHNLNTTSSSEHSQSQINAAEAMTSLSKE